MKLTEVEGDLFSAHHSHMAHVVSRDLKMDSGVGILFQNIQYNALDTMRKMAVKGKFDLIYHSYEARNAESWCKASCNAPDRLLL